MQLEKERKSDNEDPEANNLSSLEHLSLTSRRFIKGKEMKRSGKGKMILVPNTGFGGLLIPAKTSQEFNEEAYSTVLWPRGRLTVSEGFSSPEKLRVEIVKCTFLLRKKISLPTAD